MKELLTFEEFNEAYSISLDGTKKIYLKNTFGSRMTIAALELYFGVGYSVHSKLLDLTKSSILKESIELVVDKFDKKYMKVVYDNVKLAKTIDNVFNKLLKYEAVDRKVIVISHYNYDRLSMRDVLDTLIATKEGVDNISDAKQKQLANKDLEEILELAKTVFEDPNGNIEDFIGKPEHVEFIQSL